MSDLNWQNFQPTQTNEQPSPPTMASAATIAVTTRFTFLTGQVQLATVTPPVSGYHELVLCFTHAAPGALLTTGNIVTAYQPIQNRPFVMYYDPVSAKYYQAAVV